MTGKLKKFSEIFFGEKSSEFDAALITDSINRRYLLGFASSAGALIVFKDAAFFIIDSRYFEIAKKTIDYAEVILQDKLHEQIKDILKKHSAKTIAVVDDRMTIREFKELETKLSDFEVKMNSGLSGMLDGMRIIKTPEEIEALTQAQKIADDAFTSVLNFIKVGMTEKQVATELEYYMKKGGADNLSFDTICVAGANSSLPHGVPGDNKIKTGDFITMDFGALVNGYHSDMTRTVAVGKISEEQERIYSIVLEAQLKAIRTIKPGVSCKDVDSAARDYIYGNGYKGYFGHGLGHGVGLEIHELPRFSQESTHVLEENMAITVEPGIYIPGKFGVRIEDFVICTAKSSENIVKSEKKLICL